MALTPRLANFVSNRAYSASGVSFNFHAFLQEQFALMFIFLRAQRSRRRGAALLEFALVAMLLLFMVMGLIQFGVYLSTTNTLWNLSREGARYASIRPGNDDNIRNHVARVAPPSINPAKLVVRIDPSGSTTRDTGTPIRVTLTYDMSEKLVFSLPESFFGRPLGNSYTTYTEMMIERKAAG